MNRQYPSRQVLVRSRFAWAALVPVPLLLAVAGLAADDNSAKDKKLPAITGTLKYHDKFPSEFVAARNVNVWLPPSYAEKADERYPVIYMQDGQNLHDPKTSFLGVDWGVDEALTELIAADKIQEAIIVGIWNSPQRVQEYLPAKMISSRPAPEKEAIFADLAKIGLKLEEKQLLSDQYLKFLVQELKPFIDKQYRTRADCPHTFVMGSSAGALISLYAVAEYPDVFGGAGCVSTHWPIGDGLLIEYLKGRLPDPKTHRIYFDFGTETMDQGYEPYQKKMDAVMAAAGYEQDRNWLTRKFAGADHSERSWRARVHVPLEFFLKK